MIGFIFYHMAKKEPIMTAATEPISAIYGSENFQEMTRELLSTVDLARQIQDRQARICLKPNLVVASPADGGATTHIEIIEGTIGYLQEHGFDDITIAEGSWVGDATSRAFKVCGFQRVSEEYGVPLFDTQHDSSIELETSTGYHLNICSCMQDFDVLINMPVLKGHCQTYYTGALKNLKGLIPNAEKRRFHSLGLHEPIAQLNTVIRQDFIIMDGICGDPTFEEGGSPSEMNRILFSTDPVNIDSYAVTLLGMSADDVPYITRAAELGVGRLWDDSQSLREINTLESADYFFKDSELEQLSLLIEQREACSSCYANLIHALKETPADIREHYRYVIGRNFRGREQKGDRHCVGIGSCTSCCDRNIMGCPPEAEEIKRFIRSL